MKIAHAGLSDAWVQRGIWGAKQFREVEAPARAAALKAVELDPQFGEAHASLSRIKFLYDWDWMGAEQELKRALDLDPGSLATHSYAADFLMSQGRHAEAIQEIQRAEQLDPFHLRLNPVLAACFIARGNTKRRSRTSNVRLSWNLGIIQRTFA